MRQNHVVSQLVARMSDFSLSAFQIDGKKIKGSCPMSTLGEERIELSSLVYNGPKLFIYLHSPGCQICIDNLMDEIVYTKESINRKDLVFIGNYNSLKELKIAQNTNEYTDKIYDLSETEFSTVLADINRPALFIVDSKLTISCVYLADKSISSIMTVPYLQSIGKRFFNWDKKLYKIDTDHHCSDRNCQHAQ